jgi:hypothetical protein
MQQSDLVGPSVGPSQAGDCDAAHPQAGPVQPQAGPVQPQAGPAQPQAGPAQPQAGPGQPQAGQQFSAPAGLWVPVGNIFNVERIGGPCFVSRRIAEEREEDAKFETDLEQLNQNLEGLQEQRTQIEFEMEALSQDPGFRQLKVELEKTRQKKFELCEEYGQKHRDINSTTWDEDPVRQIIVVCQKSQELRQEEKEKSTVLDQEESDLKEKIAVFSSRIATLSKEARTKMKEEIGVRKEMAALAKERARIKRDALKKERL